MEPKPAVFCNYAMSADGKISTADRKGSGFASREDRRRMEAIRARADVIVVGAETVRRDDPPFHLRSPEAVRERMASGRDWKSSRFDRSAGQKLTLQPRLPRTSEFPKKQKMPERAWH